MGNSDYYAIFCHQQVWLNSGSSPASSYTWQQLTPHCRKELVFLFLDIFHLCYFPINKFQELSVCNHLCLG